MRPSSDSQTGWSVTRVDILKSSLFLTVVSVEERDEESHVGEETEEAQGNNLFKDIIWLTEVYKW